MFGLGIGRMGRTGGVPNLAAQVAALFRSGQQGAWHDESDFTTLDQVSAGTTPVTAVEQFLGLMRDKSGRSNHASQATAGNRLTLSARYNEFERTEQADNAYWTKAGNLVATPTVTANAITAPNGTLTADQLYFPAISSASSYGLIYSPLTLATGLSKTAKINLRGAVGGEVVWLMWTPNGSTYVRQQCTLTTAWQEFTIAYSSAGGVNYIQMGVDLRDASQSAKPAQTVYWWGASHVPTSDASKPYQRVVDSTTYDTAGFPQYGKLDGTASSMSSATGGGGTAGFFLCRAIKPTGGVGAVRTLFSDAQANAGYRVRLNAANQLELSSGSGTPLAPPVQSAAVNSATGGTGLAPSTAYFYVITALNAKGESLRSNEVTVTTTAGTTDSNAIAWAASSGAASYRIYRGTATGAQNVFYAVGNVLTFTDTGAASTAGAPPTVSETAYTTIATAAATVIGTTSLVTVWDDGTNLNVQLDSGTVATVARTVVAAGTAGFTIGKDNGAATGFFKGNFYPEVYRQTALTAADLASTQAYCRQKAGL